MPNLSLDIRTLIFVFIVANLLIAALMAAAFHGRRNSSANIWIASLLVQAVGWMLMSQCGGVRPLFGFVLTSLSLAMMLSALAMHFEVSQRAYWPYWPVSLAVLLLFLAPTSLPLRQAAGNSIAGLQVVMAGWLVLGSNESRRSLKLIMGTSAVIGGLTLFWRAFDVLFNGAPACTTDATASQSLSFLLILIFRLSFVFGFILLVESSHQEKMVRLAKTDPLTEAYNRRTFIELAEREIARSRRSRKSLALLIFDLDHFKRINDTHGHLIGDLVLKQVKAVANKCLRVQDLFARYGGEEFVILAPETAPAGAARLAERVRQAIACGVQVNGHPVTASIGVVSIDAVDDTVTLDGLLAQADNAMYRAKAAGRNRAAVAEPMEGEFPPAAMYRT